MKKVLISAAGTMVSVSFIKHLKKLNFYVIGIDAQESETAEFFCDEFHKSPMVEDSKAFLSFLETLDYDVFIPFLDEELQLFAENEVLVDSSKVICSSAKTLQICLNKKNTHQFALENNISVPHLTDKVPAFLRPHFGRGSKGVRKILDQDQLDNLDKSDVIVQEFIDGDEYTVDAFIDRKGIAADIVPRLRKKAANVSLQGKIVLDEQIIEFVRNIISKLDFYGPINIQVFKDVHKIYLVEINPRLAGSSILSIHAGFDLLDLSIKDFFKEDYVYNRNHLKNGLEMYRYYDELFLQH